MNEDWRSFWSIRKALVPYRYRGVIDRVNIMQIVDSGVDSLSKHIKRVQTFYSKTVPFLNTWDLNLLKNILVDFYSLLGVYTIGQGFNVNPDHISNNEWCTLKELEITMNTGVFSYSYTKYWESLDKLRDANRLILVTYYRHHAHTQIPLFELKDEIGRNRFDAL